MKTVRYGKLVRDKIPKRIQQQGGVPVVHVADDVEYWQKLKEKLQEEVEEFITESTKEELADILEVIEAICAFRDWNRAELEALRKAKAEERGGFQRRLILDEVR
jgi:predicted house-cleaning noncanonical NTP pyrophosphatase (MazG superfamily)